MFYIAIAIFSFVLTYIIKEHSIKNSLVAEVNERSSHTVPTPHGGGIAIAISWFIGLTYLFYTNRVESSLYYALMVGIIISIVSYLDDLYELSAKVRLVAQSVVAIGGLVALGGLHSINFGFFSIENQIVTNVFAFLGIVWFINLYNFLDGIDGYAGSEAIFLGIAGYILFGGLHFLVLIASVLGFLVWNWDKAKIFMGDVGSTFLGYNIAIFTIYYANQNPKNLWIWVILFALFWFDATLTLFRRYRNGEKLSQAHRKHAYQRLVQAGWSHQRVVLFSIVINILLACLIYYAKPMWLSFLASFCILYALVRFIDYKKSFY